MSANDYQVGGQHYKTTYEHWDLVLRTGIGYLEGCATKYLARWRKASKPETDLNKALHYANKLLEVSNNYDLSGRREQRWLKQELVKFLAENRVVDTLDIGAIVALVTWETKNDILQAINAIKDLLASEFDSVPATDSNKHADRV